MLDIITAVKEKFNAQKYPVEGPTYILPDGSFLDIIGTFDNKTSFEDFPCHREVEDWLIENDLSNFSTQEMSGSPTLEALGAIRCNDLKENNFIELSNIRPTSAQYESLENWIYDNAEHRSSLTVATPSFQQYKDYDPEDVEYIIKRIKRYYASGNLYENITKLEEAAMKSYNTKHQQLWNFWFDKIYDSGLSSREDQNIKNEAVNYYKNLEREIIRCDKEQIDLDLKYWLAEMRKLFDTNSAYYKQYPSNAKEFISKIDKFEKWGLTQQEDSDTQPTKSQTDMKAESKNTFIVVYSMNHYTKVPAENEEEAKQLLLSKKKNAKIAKIIPASEFKRGTQHISENMLYEDFQDCDILEDRKLSASNDYLFLKEAKKRRKRKKKALGWWQTFTPDAGNVLINNAFFNHAMGNTTTDEFMADMDAGMSEFGGDCSSGMGESLENITSPKVIEKEATNLSMKDIADIKSKNKVTEDMTKEAFRFYGKDKEGNDIEYKIDGISFTDAVEVFMRIYPDVEDWDVDTLTEAIEESQFGVHQFSTESIIFRGTQEECGQYIDDRPELWDDAEVYEIKPDDKHYFKEGQKQPLVEDGEEKVYQVIVKYKDEPTQKLEARIAKNRKDLEYQLSTDKDIEWYDFDEKQFNEDKEESKICCICGKEYSGYGNNAEPVKAGRCCDDCNLSEVIPARIAKINVSREHSMTEIFQDLNKIKK